MSKPEIISARGAVAWLLRTLGFSAVYAPNCNIYVLPECIHDDALIAHERCHHKQRLRDGYYTFWFFICWYVIRYGYWNSPYEIEAREAEGVARRVMRGATIAA